MSFWLVAYNRNNQKLERKALVSDGKISKMTGIFLKLTVYIRSNFIAEK
jgi:hypothetical protein